MTRQNSHLYEFGSYRLDPDAHVLLHQGRAVPMPPKAFDTLVLLVQQSGRLVRKEEFLKTIWPDSYVEENNLTQCISVLRKALVNEDGSPVIETVPRLGYRFIAEVRAISNGDVEIDGSPRMGSGEGAVAGASAAVAPMAVTDAKPSLSSGAPALSARPSLQTYLTLAVLLVLSAIAAIYYFARSPGLTEKDDILLADFDNSSGEPVFDVVLKEALAVKLEESPFLNVVPEQKTRETLRQMGRPQDQRITLAIAQEICQRRGVKAVMAGSVVRLGEHYVIALDAKNCITGASLAREQIDAANREEVLSAVGKAASRMRGRLGESLSSIQKFDTPIAEATTQSLDALKAFSLGEQLRAGGQQVESIPFLERAIELDPDFAMAYGRLGAVYRGIGETDRASRYSQKAFELRQKCTERERLILSASYYHVGLGDFEKAISQYEVWKQSYPRDFIPHVNLAALSNDAGQFERALAEGREGIRLNPGHILGYNATGWAAIRLNRPEEARQVFESALSQKLDSPMIHRGLYAVAFALGDESTMGGEASLSKGRDEYRLLVFQAASEASQGKLGKAQETFRRSAGLALQNKFNDAAAAVVAGSALTDAVFGEMAEARKNALAALSVEHGRDALGIAAAALAIGGDARQAEILIQELAHDYPADTLVNMVALPSARAAIEIHRGNAKKAVAILQAAQPYEFGPFVFAQGYLPIYLRGQAYLMDGKPTEAAAEFQKILDNKGAAPFAPLYPLARLQQARIYALTGEREKSARAFEDFFTLWKDADSGIPVLKQAKEEYARLKLAKPK